MDYIGRRRGRTLPRRSQAATRHDALAAFEKLTTSMHRATGASRTAADDVPLAARRSDQSREPRCAAIAARCRKSPSALRPLPFVDAAVKSSGSARSASGVVVLMLKVDLRRAALPPGQGSRGLGPGALPHQEPFDNHGEHIVAGQRRFQAASGNLLGSTKGALGHDVYIRQVHGQKGSAVVEAMTARTSGLGGPLRFGAGTWPCALRRCGLARGLPR